MKTIRNVSVPQIMSVASLLDMKDLDIPPYQRPYKWTDKNMADLFSDIDNAISEQKQKHKDYRYRIGTIILHKDIEKKKSFIVDGQQRIISLILLRLCLEPSFPCGLLDKGFDNKISQKNIHENFRFTKDWYSSREEKDKYITSLLKAYDELLKVVVITVDKVEEAFQLFDSQNSRGKELNPHDLLKAYHLREMKNYPYEMNHAVTKWEAVEKDENIKELLELYLFPIRQWISCTKSFTFTANEIDVYKGIGENEPYTYARKAKRAMPYFQIAEPFISGNDFFEMVEHYLQLLGDINKKMKEVEDENSTIREILTIDRSHSTGFRHAKHLFICALLCYYDRFRNFDIQVIKKLFTWAFMLRVDMDYLGFDSVNKYAIGESNGKYKNKIAMFSKIKNARKHSEIANMQIIIPPKCESRWTDLHKKLQELNEPK